MSSKFDSRLLDHLKCVGTPELPTGYKELKTSCEEFAARNGMTSLAWPSENLTSKRISANTSLDNTFDQDVQRITIMRDDLADHIKLFPEIGDAPITQYGSEWMKQLFGESPLWNRYFAGLLILYPYRCFTASKFQTEGHLNFIATLAVTAELIAISACQVWVPYTGQAANQGATSPYNWSSIYPTTAYNDVTLITELCESIWAFMIPAVNHPAEDSLLDCLRQMKRHYSCGWNTFIWLENHQNGKLRPSGRNGVDADVLGGDRSGLVSKSKLPLLDFGLYGFEDLHPLTGPVFGYFFQDSFDIACLSACYAALDTRPFLEVSYCEGLFLLELRDPMSRGSDKFMASIKWGELQTHGLPLLVETANWLEKSGKTEEAAEIREVLRADYGVWTTEDGTERVLSLFTKYNIGDLLKEHMLSVTLPNWMAALKKQNEQYGVPLDAVHGPLAYLLGLPLKVESLGEMERVWRGVAEKFIPSTERAFFRKTAAYEKFIVRSD